MRYEETRALLKHSVSEDFAGMHVYEHCSVCVYCYERLFEQGVRGLGVLFEVEEYEHCVFDCNCFFC
jgi:hypothetical protein